MKILAGLLCSAVIGLAQYRIEPTFQETIVMTGEILPPKSTTAIHLTNRKKYATSVSVQQFSKQDGTLLESTKSVIEEEGEVELNFKDPIHSWILITGDKSVRVTAVNENLLGNTISQMPLSPHAAQHGNMDKPGRANFGNKPPSQVTGMFFLNLSKLPMHIGVCEAVTFCVPSDFVVIASTSVVHFKHNTMTPYVALVSLEEGAFDCGYESGGTSTYRTFDASSSIAFGAGKVRDDQSYESGVVGGHHADALEFLVFAWGQNNVQSACLGECFDKLQNTDF